MRAEYYYTMYTSIWKDSVIRTLAKHNHWSIAIQNDTGVYRTNIVYGLIYI